MIKHIDKNNNLHYQLSEMDKWESAVKICPDCHGSGKCPRCSGKGLVQDLHEGRQNICPKCNGSKICQFCKGTSEAISKARRYLEMQDFDRAEGEIYVAIKQIEEKIERDRSPLIFSGGGGAGGSVIGTFVLPGIGTILGAIIGGALGNYIGVEQQKSVKDRHKKLVAVLLVEMSRIYFLKGDIQNAKQSCFEARSLVPDFPEAENLIDEISKAGR